MSSIVDGTILFLLTQTSSAVRAPLACMTATYADDVRSNDRRFRHDSRHSERMPNVLHVDREIDRSSTNPSLRQPILEKSRREVPPG